MKTTVDSNNTNRTNPTNQQVEVRKENQGRRMIDTMPGVEDIFEHFLSDRFFNDRFSTLPSLPSLPSLSMASNRAMTNVQETDQSYLLTAEIPGIPKEDVEINVSGNLLTIRAEQKEQVGEEKSSQGWRRQYRKFQQSFSLPTTIDVGKIEAHCDNGMLEILLPKTEQAQPKRVEIQSGSGSLFSRFRDQLQAKH